MKTYKIIADLKREMLKKGTTEYVRFFEFEGRGMRLDWELMWFEDENPASLEKLNRLMDMQIQNDLADEEVVASIPMEPVKPENIEFYRQKGFVDRDK